MEHKAFGLLNLTGSLFITTECYFARPQSLLLRGMEMGFNRYRLLPDGPGSWQAEVLLPACIQGRKDWLMTLEVDGRRYELPFKSD